ncbi:MAG TPA: NTP transferase domain-containing protein [Candidatus Binatia bacterium]|jgi:spore coat polysaccharide biosynthesis protein SpsF (cytidylyltransferase family)
MVRVFVQARMGSKRFPGKVLAPFQGKPIIGHVIAAAARALPYDRIVVATSGEPADDPLACYVRKLGVAVYRGALDNVVARLQACLQDHPCDWFFRLCADSPLLDSGLIEALARYSDRRDVDLVTNVFPRTFPKGQSVEMVKAETFAAIDAHRLTEQQKEHATQIYYYHPERFKIVNVVSSEPKLAEATYVVETVEDLKRLEHLHTQFSLPLRHRVQEVKQVA